MASLDTRSPATAYATKPNIVFDGSVAQTAALATRAALHVELDRQTQQPTTITRSVNVDTVTYTIRRNLP